MTLRRKISRALFVLKETWKLTRAAPHQEIFQNLAKTARDQQESSNDKGCLSYLKKRLPIARIEVTQDWYHTNGEWQLNYDSTLFAPGQLRIINYRPERHLLIVLPGFHTGATQILKEENHPHYFANFAKIHNLSLMTWDWPLQGQRLEAVLYHDLGSVYSAEREYSRILPMLGTCLWREYVHELDFALQHARSLFESENPIHVFGWSMGGAFATITPLLSENVATTTAAGTCAGWKDLLEYGFTNVHGYFFYPLDATNWFDIEDTVLETLSKNTRVLFIHGDNDPGCLAQTRERLINHTSSYGENFRLVVLPSHHHELSESIITEFIRFIQSTHSSDTGSNSQSV